MAKYYQNRKAKEGDTTDYSYPAQMRAQGKPPFHTISVGAKVMASKTLTKMPNYGSDVWNVAKGTKGVVTHSDSGFCTVKFDGHDDTMPVANADITEIN